MRVAPATTCSLVRISPFDCTTTPLPFTSTASGALAPPSQGCPAPGRSTRTPTTLGETRSTTCVNAPSSAARRSCAPTAAGCAETLEIHSTPAQTSQRRPTARQRRTSGAETVRKCACAAKFISMLPQQPRSGARLQAACRTPRASGASRCARSAQASGHGQRVLRFIRKRSSTRRSHRFARQANAFQGAAHQEVTCEPDSAEAAETAQCWRAMPRHGRACGRSGSPAATGYFLRAAVALAGRLGAVVAGTISPSASAPSGPACPAAAAGAGILIAMTRA